MINNKFCVSYKYKGSSTDFYWEDQHRFFQNEDDLGRWLVKIDIEVDSYMDVSVYSVDVNLVSYDEIDRIVFDHLDLEDLKTGQEKAKQLVAKQKFLASGLTSEDLKVLKDAKII